jgi:hypothetical protein
MRIQTINFICHTSQAEFVLIDSSSCHFYPLADMLRKADPPIPAEIWDSKTQEILMI